MKIGYELEIGIRSCVDKKNLLGFGKKFRYQEYLFLKKINKYEFSILLKELIFNI